MSYPTEKLLGSGFSTPCLPFCLVCTNSSKLKFISHLYLFRWAGVDIRWFSVDGFDTHWIPSSYSCGIATLIPHTRHTQSNFSCLIKPTHFRHTRVEKDPQSPPLHQPYNCCARRKRDCFGGIAQIWTYIFAVLQPECRVHVTYKILTIFATALPKKEDPSDSSLLKGPPSLNHFRPDPWNQFRMRIGQKTDMFKWYCFEV